MEQAREMTEQELNDTLPAPVGFKLLISLPEVETTYGSGLLKADTTRHFEEVGTVVGRVVDMGGSAYDDEKKFPNGPWCQRGDWVLFRAYSGTRFKVHGREWRLLNDDQVEAVVADPRGISRV